MAPHQLGQEGSGLICREAQVGSAQFDQLASSAQPCQWQRWVDPCGNDEMQAWRQMVEDKRQRLVDRRCVNHVVVVEHQSYVCCPRADHIEEHGQDRLDRRWLRRLEQHERGGANTWIQGIERSDNITPEADGVIFTRVQRDPGER